MSRERKEESKIKEESLDMGDEEEQPKLAVKKSPKPSPRKSTPSKSPAKDMGDDDEPSYAKVMTMKKKHGKCGSYTHNDGSLYIGDFDEQVNPDYLLPDYVYYSKHFCRA